LPLQNRFHVAFYAATLATTITLILFTLLQRRTDRPQNKWFLTMLIIVSVNAISNIGSSVMVGYAEESPFYFTLLKIFHNTYFIFHTILCPVLYCYVLNVTGSIRRWSNLRKIIVAVPFFVTEFFALVNPLTNWVFYYDNYVFRRNWAEYFIYGAAALYFILSVVEIFTSWYAITVRRRIAMTYFFALAMGGVILQLVQIDIKSELFAESLAMMGAMLAIESEDDILDADTGTYNRRALQTDINGFVVKHEAVKLIFVKVVNADMVERVTRSANSDILALACADYFKALVPRYKIYRPNPENFVLICDGYREDDVLKISEMIKDRFLKSWRIFDSTFLLDAVVIKADVPKDIQSVDDVFFVADSIVPSGVDKDGIKIEWIMRRAEIERAIRRAVHDHKFEVYYQPTYCLAERKLHGAEALVRMNDETLGFVPPDEFIPIAEKIGLVEKIDDFVLKQVCAFLESKVPEERGMECINVNLSVIQCLRPGFVEHILKIVNSYAVAHSKINFEITESVGAEDYEALSKVAHDLKKEGFLLSMDDYGTGYSNMEGIFSLDFDVVKIDKSILWNAEKMSRGRIILENSVRMIHDLGCSVLVEGVETEEQIDLLTRLNVDYLQGFYFSKPVPKDRFLEVIA